MSMIKETIETIVTANELKDLVMKNLMGRVQSVFF